MTNSQPNYYLPHWIEPSDQRLKCDVCIYGGTAAGVIAAVTAARRGLSALIVNPSGHLGGMTTGGLGCTDFGQKHVIGGASRQFYRDLGVFYGKPAGEEEWMFEPHAAQTVIDAYAKDAGVTVLSRHFLDAVESDGGAIRRIRLIGGKTVEARVFLDATYEGDLLAKAGVTYTIGREPNRRYGETINGVQMRGKHQFSHDVDPYVVPRDPSSGTLPGIDEQDAAPDGSGDHRLQAYNFRVCMTDDPALRVPWEKPEGYVELDHELARRWFRGEKDTYNEPLPESKTVPKKFDVLTARTPAGFVKTDTNNMGAVSSDYIGANYAWPEASYAARERMFQAHVTYQKGFYWTIANDPDIPTRYREAFGRFGLARD
ncbi:MAG: FAD-dependent oxidoreductase [Fibrella sp.]|nr:FAD-dependent oxidoreductase [Armatimonadota bacterium]